MKYEILLTVTLILLSVPVSAKTLQGSVEWEEHVGSHLHPGQQWQDAFLPAGQPTVEWRRIPAWMAGTWVCEYEQHQDRRTGRLGPPITSRSNEQIGARLDADGTSWTKIQVPRVERVDGAEIVKILVVVVDEPSACRNDQYACRIVSRVITYDRRTGRILSTGTQEATTISTQLSPGKRWDYAVTRIGGLFHRHIVYETTLHKVGEFDPAWGQE